MGITKKNILVFSLLKILPSAKCQIICLFVPVPFVISKYLNEEEVFFKFLYFSYM